MFGFIRVTLMNSVRYSGWTKGFLESCFKISLYALLSAGKWLLNALKDMMLVVLWGEIGEGVLGIYTWIDGHPLGRVDVCFWLFGTYLIELSHFSQDRCSHVVIKPQISFTVN